MLSKFSTFVHIPESWSTATRADLGRKAPRMIQVSSIVSFVIFFYLVEKLQKWRSKLCSRDANPCRYSCLSVFLFPLCCAGTRSPGSLGGERHPSQSAGTPRERTGASVSGLISVSFFRRFAVCLLHGREAARGGVSVPLFFSSLPSVYRQILT